MRMFTSEVSAITANYCNVKDLAANCLKLIDVSILIHLFRFSQFSRKFFTFRYTTDYCRDLKKDFDFLGFSFRIH